MKMNPRKSKDSGSFVTTNTRISIKDVELQTFPRQELTYPCWWTGSRMFCWLPDPDDSQWNCYICIVAVLAIVFLIWIEVSFEDAFDIIYNITYGMYVVSIAYKVVASMDDSVFGAGTIAGFVIDIVSYLHYSVNVRIFKLFCYYLRMHRPFRYLWALNDYNLKGSVLGTTLKYCYIFFVLRITWALIWINIDLFEHQYMKVDRTRALYEVLAEQRQGKSSNETLDSTDSLNALYIVNKMFIPIGPSVAPANDTERIACLLVMLTGCLVVTGAAVASLSLVISIYMRPEEAFRERYRLIMKEMKESQVPPSLREKVETFYKMYWHKLRGVSATQLLPTYPPSLANTIYTNIYFAATQKSRVLRNLSYGFLSELAKKMQTVLYIPGDAIIKRNSTKSTIIYIAYGDIEMLSAEDDSTAMLRMTRGSSLAGCAGGAPAGCARAHVDIRAATFCITHALHARELWLVALKQARYLDRTPVILTDFYEHLEKVKRQYYEKAPENAKYKSSILHFKRNLMALKEARDADGNRLLGRSDVFLEIAGSYLLRNRAVASQTDEADAICLRPTFPCILQPSSSLQMAWQWFISCVIVTVCFTHPYYLVFKKKVPLEFRFFDYVVTLLYVLDLIVHLSTGANVEEGVPITFMQTSSQQMRSRWFVLDVVGTLPILEFIGEGHFAGINKLLRLPKVFRMLKSMEGLYVYSGNVLRFFSYTLLLLIACYLIAALQQGFMCFQFGYCMVSNFTHSPYWENKELDEERVTHHLSFGLYWAISMITFTSHKETWGIENWKSILYTMFVLEICIVLHIFIEAVYSATIMVTTALREDYDSCIANVKDFLIRNQVDPQLRQRFTTYLQLCWYTDKAYSMTNKKTSIFYDLPPHVYQDIVTRQRSKYLLSIPFMKLLNKEDLKNVSSKAKLFYTSPNEILLNTGDISNEMYVIKQGMCEILSPDSKEVVGTLGVKHYFGVIECLLRLPAYYTVRAVTHVQVFSISKKVLSHAMQLPQLKDAIEFAKDRPEYARLLSRREAFVSYEAPARAPNTERFSLPRKYEADYAFLHPFKKLGFFSILRYIFPRFTIRPDGAYLMHYEWFRATCALLAAALFPSYSYLALQWPSLYYLTLLLDTAAYFDIVQRMLVGYYNAQGVLVYHPASTAAYYMRGAFIVDLLACLPLENLESPLKESFQNNYRLTQSRQVLMLNRLLQLYRLPSAMRNLDGVIERRDILLVIKAIPLFMALLNVLTCMMVFYSVNIFREADSDAWLIVPIDDEGGSWVHLFAKTFRFNFTETPWNLHVATYFWVVYETTTTGYNSFNPSNFALMNVLFIGMVIGAMMTTYFSVRIISIRSNVNKELAAYQEHIKDILTFMHREKLSKQLQKTVLDYYEYNWEKMGGVEYTSVLKLCDQITLRTDAILNLYGPTFEKCPFLAESDVSLLRLVGRAVCSAYFLRDMKLVDVDDVIHDLYFVDYGIIAVGEGRLSNAVVKLTRGSVFGNLDNVATLLSKSAIVTHSRVHLLRINAVAFHHIISDFPQVAKHMKDCRSDNEDYIMGSTDNMLMPEKDQFSSSIMLFRSRKGLVWHIYYKDKFFHLYLIVVSLACIYTDVYNACFQDNSASLILVLYALDVGFYLKILVHYTLPFLVKSEYLKMTLIPLRKKYFQQEFKYDLISCLPTELLSFAFRENQWMTFSWLRLNRMLRIVTVYNCLKRHQERITMNLTVSVVLSVLIWFTLFVHTTACLWYFIGMLQDQAKPKTSWMHNDVGGSWCNNLYICSVYFVLTTFTQNGVGDIMPKNHAEVIFVSILQIVSTLVYMVYVGEFSNIIQYQSYRSIGFYCKYLELQEFLKNNRVSKSLVKLVNHYSLHLWHEARGMQVPYFLSSAPQGLRLRVMTEAYMEHLKQNPVFKECEPAFLRQLVGCLQLYTYNEGMYVVKENEITDAMYMIHTGHVNEISSQFGKRRKYYYLECFGLKQGLFYDIPYPYSYCTPIKSRVLTLKLSDWEYLLKHFPRSKKSIYKCFRDDDDSPDNTGVQPELGKTDKISDPDDGAPSVTSNYPSTRSQARITPGYTAPNIPTPTAEMPTTEADISPTTIGVPSLESELSLLTCSCSNTKFNSMIQSPRPNFNTTQQNLTATSPSDTGTPVAETAVKLTTETTESVDKLVMKDIFSMPITRRSSEIVENTSPNLFDNGIISARSYLDKEHQRPPVSTNMKQSLEPSASSPLTETFLLVPLPYESTLAAPQISTEIDVHSLESNITQTNLHSVNLDENPKATSEHVNDPLYLWPLHNRLSDKSIIDPGTSEVKAELEESKSSQLALSLVSIPLSSRQPRDIEEALEDSSTFIEKAKQFISHKKDKEKSYVPESEESSSKESLFVVEKKVATSKDPMKTNKKRTELERDINLQKIEPVEEVQQHFVSKPDKTGVQTREEVAVKIQEPLENDTYAVVPFNKKAKHIRVEEPSNSLKRSVHYREHDLTYAADSESFQNQSKLGSLDIGSDTSSETEKTRPEDEAGPSRGKDPKKKKDKID